MSLWLEKTCNQIAEHNGYKERVKVKWDRMNLTDESSVKNLILAFYDRGLISIESSLKKQVIIFRDGNISVLRRMTLRLRSGRLGMKQTSPSAPLT